MQTMRLPRYRFGVTSTTPATVLVCVLLSYFPQHVKTDTTPATTFNHSRSLRTVRHSLSGMSAGGSMVASHLMAHSTLIDGAAIIAGSPYACGHLPDYDNSCNYDDPPIDVDALVKITAERERAGLIDPTSTLAKIPLYLFGGTKDSVTYPGVMNSALKFFQKYVDRDALKGVYNVPAEHGYVTDGYGECCDCSWGTYILNCKYDQAGDLFKHIYGKLETPPNWDPSEKNVHVVMQRAYAPEGSWWPSLQMHETAWAYVPSACRRSNVTSCRLHVHYHGCGGGGAMPEMELGYNQWADANDIVVLYPMARPAIGNLMGCWDWWGATGKNFDTNEGVQIQTVMNMISDLPNAISWTETLGEQ